MLSLMLVKLMSLFLSITRKLSEPVHGTLRNITSHNWFTTVPMADKMLNDYI